MLEMHLDPLGGVAGDMFVAALLHLRPDLEAGLARTIAICPLLDRVDVSLAPHDDGVLTGRRFVGATRSHTSTLAADQDSITRTAMRTWTGVTYAKR